MLEVYVRGDGDGGTGGTIELRVSWLDSASRLAAEHARDTQAKVTTDSTMIDGEVVPSACVSSKIDAHARCIRSLDTPWEVTRTRGSSSGRHTWAERHAGPLDT
jgi:hypothetical protein